MTPRQERPELRLPPLPCACASLRRAARAVSRLYDADMAATGLPMAQFTLLMALNLAGEVNQASLSRILALDQTTLTRTLGPLLKRGLIQARPGMDRRERHFSLSAAGRRKHDDALPHWKKAQAGLQRSLKPESWAQLTGLLDEVAKAAVPT